MLRRNELGRERGQQGLDVPLDVIKVARPAFQAPLFMTRIAIRQPPDPYRLAVAAGRVLQKTATHLEKARTRLLAAYVVNEAIEQPTCERRAHYAHLARYGIGESNRRGVSR